MLFRTLSAAVYGIDADLVDIEVDLTPARGEAESPNSVTIVGLPDAAPLEESPSQQQVVQQWPLGLVKPGAPQDFAVARADQIGLIGDGGWLIHQQGIALAIIIAGNYAGQHRIQRWDGLARDPRLGWRRGLTSRRRL